MGRIVVTEFVSLDGVMEDPGGSENFKHGGWSFKFDRGEDGDKFKLDETMDSTALLLGRKTWEGFADAWPSRDGEFADKFNNMPKYVGGDVVEAVSKLKREQDGNIVVHGSAQLTQTLLENDLVDELRLMVFPVILGTGKRIFGDLTDSKRLKLSDSKTVGEGVSILVYQPAAA